MFKYQAAVELLKGEITSGRWRAGDVFLGVKDICARFQVSYLTAIKILKGLESLHLVETRRGSGTYVTQRRKRICFLSPDFGLAQFFPLIRKEIAGLCQRNGISFDICEVANIAKADYPARLEKAVCDLIETKPSGIIYLPSTNITPVQDCILPHNNIDRRILEAFDTAGIPVVLIDSGIESPLEDHYDLVGVDNRAIGVKLGRHLLEQKARKVMFVSWKSHSPNVNDRKSGLNEALLDKGLTIASYELTKSNLMDFRQTMKSPGRPDAIVGSSDRIALMVLHILQKAKIKVPEDILLAGIDDTEQSKTTLPGLTTVRQPYQDIARAACELLLNRIARPSTPPRHLTVATTLIPRASTLKDSSLYSVT